MEALDNILAEQPFFKGIAPDKLAELVECAHPVTFYPNEYLFREGEPAQHFYILTHGRVALEIHVPGQGDNILQTVTEGEVLGWSWLFAPYKWQFDGRALSLTRALVFNGLCIRGKCDADHDLGYELTQRFGHVLYERLQATRLQLLDMYRSR